jgi:hypothetical protein
MTKFNEILQGIKESKQGLNFDCIFCGQSDNNYLGQSLGTNQQNKICDFYHFTCKNCERPYPIESKPLKHFEKYTDELNKLSNS